VGTFGQVDGSLLKTLPRQEKGDSQMIATLKSLHQDESGQDLIEYGLIALIVALGALSGMGLLAKSINKVFTQVAGQLT
jgi:pilus assembly protein Flp/PilA